MKRQDQNGVSYFGRTNFRNQRKLFGIYQSDRLFHYYVLGKTGSGKTTLLQTLMTQDIYHQRGFCLIDVHGDLVERVHRSIAKSRLKDVVYLDATNPNLKMGYNPLKKVSPEKRPLVTSSILEIFEHLWGGSSWGVKLAHILRNVLLSLLDQPEASLLDVLRILQDKDFREKALGHVTSKEVRDFWTKEFKNYSAKTDLIPIYNKLGGLLAYPSVRRILVSNHEQISLRRTMDGRKILLVNLSKGHLGSDASYILASLLLTSISSAGFSRIDTPSEQRAPFFCYLDEFQNYTTKSVASMLSELRKFKIGLIMANQYLGQLDGKIRDAVLGNVGTMVCFRLGLSDARIMEKEFYPVFQASDFTALANYDIYVRLVIHGKPCAAFSATTITPYELPELYY